MTLRRPRLLTLIALLTLSLCLAACGGGGGGSGDTGGPPASQNATWGQFDWGDGSWTAPPPKGTP